MPRTSGTRPKGNGTGRGAASKGQGWGGPAKGAGNGAAKGDFLPGNSMASLRDEERIAEKKRRAMEMEDVIYALATKAEKQDTQLTAAAKLHEIYEGKPVARVAAEPGTAAGFVIYGEREASSTDAWEKANPPPA